MEQVLSSGPLERLPAANHAAEPTSHRPHFLHQKSRFYRIRLSLFPLSLSPGAGLYPRIVEVELRELLASARPRC